jgi:adenylosuccinate lyase
MDTPDYSKYQSPYSWRYGSDEMRNIWGEIQKRKIWRRLWVNLAEVQSEYGLVTSEQVADLKTHAKDVDLQKALKIEAEIHHDLMAELQTFAQQCQLGGGILHLGMTSTDIVDNADALRVRDSLDLILIKLVKLLNLMTDRVEQWADTPIMGFTHLQPAEPTTLGYRLAQYAQDLLMDWTFLSQLRRSLKGKGIKGATGTGASFAELIGLENLNHFEETLSKKIGLPFYQVTTQVYPRKQDYWVLSGLAGLGASLHKFAFDLRILQSPSIGEWSEPFGTRQIGSSAMPFKRNPIRSEKTDSIARLLAQLPRLAWDNAAHTALERTLDDSANRRTSLPEAFLITDEILITVSGIITGMNINQTAIEQTLGIYGPFAGIERVLMALVKMGADRQIMHAHLRDHALAAWQQIQKGGQNPLETLLVRDIKIRKYIDQDTIRSLLDSSQYIGNAPNAARSLVQEIRATLNPT